MAPCARESAGVGFVRDNDTDVCPKFPTIDRVDNGLEVGTFT
jgi:hypothetical protein